VSDDPLRSWVVTKRFREFDDLNTILKEYGYDFDLPPKKILGRTDKAFMAERQKGLQVGVVKNMNRYKLSIFFLYSLRHISIHLLNNSNFVIHY